MIIRSTANHHVKKIRDQLKIGWPDPQGRVLVEGPKLIEEAVKSRLKIDSLYISETRKESSFLKDLLKSSKSKGVETLEFSEGVFDQISSTETPQGISALVYMPKWNLESIIENPAFIVVGDRLQDPGNLGTLLRSAEAFGTDAVILTRNSVSPYNLKALRASAGSVFRVPVFAGLNPREISSLLVKRGFRLYATSPGAGTDYRQIDFRGRLALIVGNEGQGLEDDFFKRVDDQLTIPLSPTVESLNVAVAVSIILSQAASQRRMSPQ
ncbi:MAG: RNA methyltransferase [Terriglobia bacterium]